MTRPVTRTILPSTSSTSRIDVPALWISRASRYQRHHLFVAVRRRLFATTVLASSRMEGGEKDERVCRPWSSAEH